MNWKAVLIAGVLALPSQLAIGQTNTPLWIKPVPKADCTGRDREWDKATLRCGTRGWPKTREQCEGRYGNGNSKWRRDHPWVRGPLRWINGACNDTSQLSPPPPSP